MSAKKKPPVAEVVPENLSVLVRFTDRESDNLFYVSDSTSEHSDFIIPITGEILVQRNLGMMDEGDPVIIGKFKLLQCNVAHAAMEGIDLPELLDSHSQDSYEFTQCFDEDGEATEALMDATGEPIAPDCLLLVERIEIIGDYRGCGIGPRVLHWLIQRFAPSVYGIVLLQPVPLQHVGGNKDKGEAKTAWEVSMRFEDLETSKRTALSKLKKSYGKLGFKSVAGTPYMALAIASFKSKPPQMNVRKKVAAASLK